MATHGSDKGNYYPDTGSDTGATPSDALAAERKARAAADAAINAKLDAIGALAPLDKDSVSQDDIVDRQNKIVELAKG